MEILNAKHFYQSIYHVYRVMACRNKRLENSPIVAGLSWSTGDLTSVPGSYTGNRRDARQVLGFKPPLEWEIQPFPLWRLNHSYL